MHMRMCILCGLRMRTHRAFSAHCTSTANKPVQISPLGQPLFLWIQDPGLANTCPCLCDQVTDEGNVITDRSGIKDKQLKAWATEGLMTGA